MKPAIQYLCVVILAACVFLLVGCGSSSCDTRLAPGAPGACSAGSSSSSSGTGSGTGSTPGSTTPTGPFTIGGTVIGLTGTGLVLQDNGGDSLTLSTNGPFTFKVPITGGGTYKVTVATQPSNQTLPCSVNNSTGSATANVTNVEVTCGNTYTISGTVTGLQGSGLVLQDNGGDNASVSANAGKAVNFSFATPLAGGSAYNVTILTQPTNPAQLCTVSNGSGSATGNVTTVQITCPQSGFTVGGTLVGLVNGPGDTVELMNNGGDNILVTGNNTNFIFPTLVTSGGAYDINIFAQPTSQTQPCVILGYEGVVTFDISNVIIDCQHNDWIWIDAPNTANNYGVAGLPPAIPPSHNTNFPGGRQFAAAWTDSSGQKWLYGGWGLELTGKTPPDLPGLLDDLWLYDEGSNGWIPAGLPISTATQGGVTTDKADLTIDENTDEPALINPGARWGSISWSDASGNLWLFGGQGSSVGAVSSGVETGLLNDLWEFTPTGYDITTPPPPAQATHIGSYTETGNWTNSSPGGSANYGTQGVAAGANLPGPRWGAAYTTNPQGTFVYVFGGQGVDGAGNLGLLNDLWKYDIVNKVWTWLGPSNSTVGQNNGVYGTQGTASAANAPGGRQQAQLWVDASGNVWLFGGLGLDSAGTRNPGSLSGLATGTATPDGALLNDLWEYNGGTGQWTWISGGGTTGIADQQGVYGTAQVPAAGNTPGSRWGSAGFIDPLGSIWLIGGWGYGSSTAQSTGYLNDVWQYVNTTGQWIWWKGSNDADQAGFFPTDLPPSWGVPYVKNTPGGRFGAAYWKEDPTPDFYFWMFGGEGFDVTGTPGRLSDLLVYLPFPKPQ